MAEENSVQEPEQGQEQTQETEPAQEPEEKRQEDKPDKEKDGGGLLMPVLYALLAAAGAFTLVMIIGIVITFLTRPTQPSETPSAEPPSQSAQVSDQAWRSPDGEGLYPDAAPRGDTALYTEI